MKPLLIDVLKSPGQCKGLDLNSWETLIRQARSAQLLSRLGYALEESDMLQHVPDRPRRHVMNARVITDKQVRDLRYEVSQLQAELDRAGVDTLLLKGAAYVIAELAVARGRICSDVDILVPKSKIDEAERQLKIHGWTPVKSSPYDQRYYRKWMHEIPPLVHIKRQTTLDVHHNIMPITARWRPDAAKLFEKSVALNSPKGVKTLCPVDMLLHSTTHLFQEGELDKGLRDLLDLDSLFREFGNTPGFWDDLVPRASDLGLQRPLYYGVRYCRKLLSSPIPERVVNQTKTFAPPKLLNRLMDSLFMRALVPHHPSCEDRFTGIARWLLYIRSHYLRMPPHLLIPHLVRKAVVGRFATVED